MSNNASELRYSIAESEYNKLVKAYNLVNCLTDFSTANTSSDTVQLNAASLTDTLGLIADLAESIFSAEVIKTDPQ